MKVVRSDYLNMYKSSATLKSDKVEDAFSAKADNESPLKKQKT